MAGKRDYYEVLGVERTANIDTIEKSYRRLARQHHPDRNIGDPEAEQKFKELNEAHDILTNEEKRARYDRYGHAGVDPNAGGGSGFGPAGGNFNDIVNDLFGAFMGGGGSRRRSSGPQRGGDLRQILDIDLVEALKGVKKSINVQRHDPCNECNGKGSKSGKRNACQRCNGKGEFIQRQGFFEFRQACPSCQGVGTVISDPCPACSGQGRTLVTRSIEVKIPAGAETGMRLMVGGEGDAGDPGAPRGDLELVIRVAEHSDFERDGRNLICAIPITFSQAALGATIDVPTLTGSAKLTIPRGTQNHTELRIRGEGMPELRVGRNGTVSENDRRGDLRVIVVIETPTHLTSRQEELFRELAEIEHSQVSPERKSFLDKIKGLFKGESEK